MIFFKSFVIDAGILYAAGLPFQDLEKGIVLQEKHLFNATPINARKCSALITKLLYLLVQGEKFTRQEATDVFFAVTKLFQSKDVSTTHCLKSPNSITDSLTTHDVFDVEGAVYYCG
jgi:hypothetical protein